MNGQALSPPSQAFHGVAAKPREVARFTFTNEAGEPLYYKVRYEPGKTGGEKSFQFFQGNGQPGRGCEPVLYNLPKVLEAGTVIITEGEAKADLLNSWGMVATSMDSGAGSKLTDEMITQLSGRRIVILRDNDEPGLKFAEITARALVNECPEVKVVLLPGLPEKGDILDWVREPGNDWSRLAQIIENAEPWKNSEIVETQEWLEPLLFGEIETPEIPCELLPAEIGAFCKAVTDAAQTPQALSVMLALPTLAACLQKRFEVCPYGDDYSEPVSIWAVTALDPGNRKTAVKAALTDPLTTWESEQGELLKARIRETDLIRDVNLKRIEQLKAKAAKPETPDEDREQYMREISELQNETPDAVKSPRIWTDDVTPERLQALLADNGERMALLSDEGGIFEVMAGLYSNGRVNLNVFLQGHAGAPVRVDRQGRTVTLNKPALTFGLAVQPDIISDLAHRSKRLFRGTGTLARFLYCIPKSTVGHRDITRRVSIPPSVKMAYNTKIKELLDIEPVYDEQGREQARMLTLTPDALQAWEVFCWYIESRQGPNGEFYAFQDWSSKLPGAALRIAGLLHVAEHGPANPKINRQTMEKALDLCDLLIVHAKAAFDLMGDDQASNDAKAVLDWIISQRKPSFTQNEAYKSIRRFRSIDRLNKALQMLSLRHIISEPIKKKTGGRPTIVYTVNPDIEIHYRVQKAQKGQKAGEWETSEPLEPFEPGGRV